MKLFPILLAHLWFKGFTIRDAIQFNLDNDWNSKLHDFVTQMDYFRLFVRFVYCGSILFIINMGCINAITASRLDEITDNFIYYLTICSVYTPKWWATLLLFRFLIFFSWNEPDIMDYVDWKLSLNSLSVCKIIRKFTIQYVRIGHFVWPKSVINTHTNAANANKHCTVKLKLKRKKNLISLNFIQLTRDISRWRRKKPSPSKSSRPWQNATQDIMLIACDFIWKLFRHCANTLSRRE